MVFVLMMLISLSVFSQSQRVWQHNALKEGDLGYSLYNSARRNYKSDSCLDYANKLQEIAKRHQFPLAAIYAQRILCRYYMFTNKFDKAYKASQKLAILSKKFDNTLNWFVAYDSKVNLLIWQNKIPEAIDVYMLMDKEAVTKKSREGKFYSEMSRASIFLSRENTTEARNCYFKALALKDSLTDLSYISLYNKLAWTYPIGSDSTIYYLKQGLADVTNLTDSLNLYSSLMRAYAIRNDAYNFYKLRDIYNKKTDSNYIGNDATWEMNLFDAMFKNDRKKMDALLINRTDTLQKLFYGYIVLKNIGDFDQALKYYERRQVMIDSINSIITSRSILNMEKDKQSIKDRSTNEFKLFKERYRMSQTVLIIFFIAIVIILFFLVYSVISNNRNLQSVSDMKTLFVQNMSHEIRTPLNAIVGFSQLLSLPDGVLTEDEKHNYSEYIMTNTNMLTMLIDDILNLSDVESGNYRVSFDLTKCNEAAEATMKNVELRVPEGVKMYFTTEVDNDFNINTDAHRVQQVLTNFLTNACKHTEKGEIHIHCSISENPGYVTYSVTDTGTGIPEEKAEEIFERFTKLNAFAPGTGLGLSICRMIAKKLNGIVKLDTTYKNGSRFIFMIPNTQE